MEIAIAFEWIYLFLVDPKRLIYFSNKCYRFDIYENLFTGNLIFVSNYFYFSWENNIFKEEIIR